MDKSERRISKRVKADFNVNFIHGGDYLISQTRDISVDGMFLYTKKPSKQAEHTTLSFSLGDLHDLKVEAEVIWANKTSSQDSGMAVKFLNPSDDLQTAILEIINKIAILEEKSQ
jgi:hypothetical protein